MAGTDIDLYRVLDSRRLDLRSICCALRGHFGQSTERFGLHALRSA